LPICFITEIKMKIDIYNAHYLLPSRFDNWIRLLVKNGFQIKPSKIPQALYITLTSLVLFPFALAEMLIFAYPIHKTKITKGPVFVIGHWRSGTTYLQNVLTRDPQFGWFDPVHTTTFSNSLLLGWLVGPPQKKLLKDARPMDNLRYSLDLPMEEVFAQATICPNGVIQMLSFPRKYYEYVKSAFVTDLTEREQRDWWRSYTYILKKMTYISKGKCLVLKSPDNTSRARLMLERFPTAKFINIHRDPYVTIMSTVHMFKKETELLALNDPPEGDYEQMIEDTVIDLFARMYRELFKLKAELPAGVIADVRYEDFAAAPTQSLRRIYTELGLDGFDEALPRFEKYISSLGEYQRNKFTLTERLRRKINAKLGFYFEYYGYEMQTAELEGAV